MLYHHHCFPHSALRRQYVHRDNDSFNHSTTDGYIVTITKEHQRYRSIKGGRVLLVQYLPLYVVKSAWDEVYHFGSLLERLSSVVAVIHSQSRSLLHESLPVDSTGI